MIYKKKTGSVLIVTVILISISMLLLLTMSQNTFSNKKALAELKKEIVLNTAVINEVNRIEQENPGELEEKITLRENHTLSITRKKVNPAVFLKDHHEALIKITDPLKLTKVREIYYVEMEYGIDKQSVKQAHTRTRKNYFFVSGTPKTVIYKLEAQKLNGGKNE